MANLELNFVIENIGPHEQLNFNGITTSLKTAFYANNGSGKTFISRLFRLLEESSIEKSNKLLSFSKNTGKFEFKISNPQSGDEFKFDIRLSRDNEPVISSPLPYFFHTFNSDYVNENIEALGYKPDGNIEGYILGKTLIDLTKEKEELTKEISSLDTKKEQFHSRVESKKSELDKSEFGIRKNTTEYTSFTMENIFQKKDLGFSEKKTFSELKKENTTLNALPDDISDIAFAYSVNTTFFGATIQLMKTPFTKSNFAEEFKTKIKLKQKFIEDGLALINEEKKYCPFCEQTLNSEALNLIDTYTKYLTDEEAKIITQIDNFIKQIEALFKQLMSNGNNLLIVNTEFEELKKYLPSFKEKKLSKLKSVEDLKSVFEDIKQRLIEKKNDITIEDLIIEEKFKIVEKFISENINLVKSNEKIINEINKRKNNINTEKLEIKKRLCKAQYLETLKEEMKNIDEINDLKSAILVIENEIKEKENQSKALKKDKVIESFESFLNVFFAGKYTFDKENFCLKFKTHNLINNASDVLSDGEKSIVAFCFYLAETHKIIENEDDYQKLFFIIDDPISSLDFHYVYSISQIIKRLNSKFPIGEKLKFIVLTHNIEFMSILIRNNIVAGQFIIENSAIKKLKKELIMPYEEHLKDIYDISENLKQPLHTTPNSIRHVLETINKFEKPNLNFLDYCDYIELLKDDNEFLYALVHDNSHGNYRTQRPFTSDMITKGCKKTIEVINSKFDGQIEVIKNRLLG